MGWLLLSHGHANPASRVPYCPPRCHAHVAEAVVALHRVGVALNQIALLCLLLGS